MKIYVGNISRTAEEEDVQNLFESYGKVTSCVIIKDRFNGESKGFGFVEMSSADDAQKAIEGVNGSQFGGRSLIVSVARPPSAREEGGNGGGFERQRRFRNR